jgi:multidrug efflux pump subunit AcrA (membrane-fusion protein)
MSATNGFETPVPPPSSKGLPTWLAVLVSLGMLAAAIGTAVFLFKTRPKPAKEPEAAVAPVVEVIPAKVGAHAVRLRLHGQVRAAQQVVLMPEVGGRVQWLSDNLVPGGFVKQGEPLVRIDARDYALALEQQRAQLQNQKLQLEVEKARRGVAAKEWEIYKKEREKAGLPVPDEKEGDGGPPLALREPHVKSAEVALDAAESSIQRAQLQLSKTALEAPFNAFVQQESVDKGQLVGPTSQLATLVGTDAFWVQVSVPFDKLAYIQLPSGDTPGSETQVFMETGAERVARTGRVIRLLGDLDPVGRMARVLVQIDDPFMLKEKGSPAGAELEGAAAEGEAPRRDPLPILLGSFVRVEIEGETLQNVAELPRSALMADDVIHVLSKDDTLAIKKVKVIWGNPDTVLVRGPIENGDRLIVTTLSAPVEGMKLRKAEAAPSSASAKGAPDGGGKP